MSLTTYYMLLVPAALAALAGAITYLMRNELPDGAARPEIQRIVGGLWAFVIVLVLSLFAAFVPTWFAVYFITWWVTLFAVLPFGIRSQHESGTVIPGTEAGAPEAPRMKRKIVLTTMISLPVFAVILAAVRFLPIL